VKVKTLKQICKTKKANIISKQIKTTANKAKIPTIAAERRAASAENPGRGTVTWLAMTS
jgi:hypothetical protein